MIVVRCSPSLLFFDDFHRCITVDVHFVSNGSSACACM